MSITRLAPEHMSAIEQLAMLDADDQERLIGSMDEEAIRKLIADWDFFARPKQQPPPGHWNIWLILAGRGWGKTQTGAQWVRQKIKQGARRIALVAPTSADARDVMVEGPSGIIEAFRHLPKDQRPHYTPGKRRITWPNGTLAFTYSAEEPNRLRGPQHDFAWGDEVAAWQYPDAYDQLMFGLRLGRHPQCILTTTPKPTKLIRELAKRATLCSDLRSGAVTHGDVAMTRGSTYENVANLASTFINETIRKYEGTTLGRQELYAEILEDLEGALWNSSMIEAHRVLPGQSIPDMKRIVVAVDPAVTSKKSSDETGIIVIGLGVNGHLYVFYDGTLRGTPNTWAKKVIELYHLYTADRIIGEVNNGGELVESVLRNIDANIPYTAVNASRGKTRRAEPIVGLYEQGKVHHVGVLAALEQQMTTWRDDLGMPSPDRMDALVWGATELTGARKKVFIV